MIRFVVTLQTTASEAAAIRALRRLLKYALRQCGLRAVSVTERRPDPVEGAQ
jgi:hypothetical protein